MLLAEAQHQRLHSAFEYIFELPTFLYMSKCVPSRRKREEAAAAGAAGELRSLLIILLPCLTDDHCKRLYCSERIHSSIGVQISTQQ